MTSEQTVTRDGAVDQDRDFQDVCALEDVTPGTGVAALVSGEQIAVVRTTRDLVVALSNFDPFSRAFVISRGIVGDKGGVPKIASPIFKQNFSLLTGECLDDPKVRLPVYPCRVVGGRILVSVKRPEPS
ncbi:MAG TPA: nitrite reductase small subunit NirD [Polyangiaceae bacterium]|nr:nitrite reductase small subunit NirD [Polyangiaceae bacterium]